jgi:hypothetical protein
MVVPVNTGGILRLRAIAAWRFSVASDFASSTKNTRPDVGLLAKVGQEGKKRRARRLRSENAGTYTAGLLRRRLGSII